MLGNGVSEPGGALVGVNEAFAFGEPPNSKQRDVLRHIGIARSIDGY